MLRICLALLFLAAPAMAQQAVTAPGGTLRILDKLSGEVTDVTLLNGQTAQLGFLRVTLRQCRYPADNPSGDAYAELEVNYRNDPTPSFVGWMLASSPALHAMDHPRYDVWALRCTTS